MRRIAIIPARGGSKRLPRKNILDFKGKPMIAWTIEAAQKTALFEKIVVSTEDQEIAEIASSFGAVLDKRDPELASDDARVVDVCLDYLKREEHQGNGPCDILCCLYATAPLRNVDDIAQTVGLIDPGTCDFALAATHYDLPPHQALRVQDNNKVQPIWPELVNMRSADVGELVVDNGSTYAVNVDTFKQEKNFYGQNLKAHIMPWARSQDIDEDIDLEIARFFAQRIEEQKVA